MKIIPLPGRFSAYFQHLIWLGAILCAMMQFTSCGGGAQSTSIQSGPPEPPKASGKTLANLHGPSGWAGYALLPKAYQICNSCLPTGPEATWLIAPGIGTPSKSGNATRFDIGGQTHFADVLWNNHLIGDFSSQGLPDSGGTLVPTLHNFTYDVYFYGTNLASSQALEFDINQFFNGQGFIWGNECRIAGGHEWDTWDNAQAKWVPTGVPCNPVDNSWNHLTIQVQRTVDDQLVFKSISLNGVVNNLNITRSPGAAPSNWYGVTINYQMDGNTTQQPYSVYLDQLNFTYE